MAALNPKWAIVDFIADATMLLFGIGEIRAILTAVDLPETVVTIEDLYKYVEAAVNLLKGSTHIANNGAKAAMVLINAFKNTSIPINNDDYKDVKKEGPLEIYLTPDGIAGLLGAKTVALMVLSGDGHQLALWNTKPDQSWIATDQQRIVRSKHGSIWTQDPGSGKESWPVA